ncbi:semaphorin-4C isoform X3 [Mixophyes fleayi]|uniref:semaphorin-4C isoform X3 n=1 Tax=Mixophyes fleayi TaxID=3061075 RepID=UPI003F4DD997
MDSQSQILPPALPLNINQDPSTSGVSRTTNRPKKVTFSKPQKKRKLRSNIETSSANSLSYLDESNRKKTPKSLRLISEFQKHTCKLVKMKPIGQNPSKNNTHNRIPDFLPRKSTKQCGISQSNQRPYMCNGRKHKNGIFSRKFQSSIKKYKRLRKRKQSQINKKDLSGQEVSILHNSPRRHKCLRDSELQTEEHRDTSDELILHPSRPATSNRCGDLSGFKTSGSQAINQMKANRCHVAPKRVTFSDVIQIHTFITESGSKKRRKSPRVDPSPTSSEDKRINGVTEAQKTNKKFASKIGKPSVTHNVPPTSILKVQNVNHQYGKISNSQDGTKNISDYNFPVDWSPPIFDFLYSCIPSKFESKTSNDVAINSIVMTANKDSCMSETKEDSHIIFQKNSDLIIAEPEASQSDVILKPPISIDNTTETCNKMSSSDLITTCRTIRHLQATDQFSWDKRKEQEAPEKPLKMDQVQIPVSGSRYPYNNIQEENVCCTSQEEANRYVTNNILSSPSCYLTLSENNSISASEPNLSSNVVASIENIDSNGKKQTYGSPIFQSGLLTSVSESNPTSVSSSQGSDHLHCKKLQLEVSNFMNSHDCLVQEENLREVMVSIGSNLEKTVEDHCRGDVITEVTSRSTHIESSFSSEQCSGFTHQVSLVQDGFLSLLYPTLRCPRPVLHWLFQLLSSNAITSLYAFKTLWNISMGSITKANQDQQEDAAHFLWCPSLENILSVLQCLGASCIALYPIEKSNKQRTNRGVRFTQPVLDTAALNHPYSYLLRKNLNNVLKFLTLCAIGSPHCFSDHELLIFIPILCKVSLDINIKMQPMEDLRQLLLILLNNVTDWQAQLSKLCSSLSQLSSHHHNLLSIVQLLPYNSGRARQLKKQLSLLIITKLLSRSVKGFPWKENIQLPFLCQLLKYMKPSALKQQLEQGHTAKDEECQSWQARLDLEAYYLCHTLLTLTNNVVGTEIPSSENLGNLHYLCVNLQRHICSNIRESPMFIYRSKLKNLATYLHVRWKEMLTCSSPQTPALGNRGPNEVMIPRWLCIVAILLRIEVRGWNEMPRKTVRYSGVSEVRQFWHRGISHYLTLTLDENRGALYVGAREIIFTLDLNNIGKELRPPIIWEAPSERKEECVNKGKSNQTECFNYIRLLQQYNETHLITCGTYAFQPKCAYIELPSYTLDSVNLEDGRGKCPYDPSSGHTGLVVDGILYSATLFNFLGTEPVIQRSVAQHSIKTEYLATWLNEANFVGSAHIPESLDNDLGDDDKIYFFFTERALEYDCYSEQVVSRVARVCKGDSGGARTLQKKWTSFLKARLVCSIPEQQLHFNLLQSVFTLRTDNWRSTEFYAVFQARWGDVAVSAVCRYSIQDIQKAFGGPYKEYREQAQKWGRYSESVPSPRPGSCITDYHRRHRMASSMDLPDNTLNFAKKHPLMDESVQPVHGRPLLVRKGVNLTTLAVHRTAGLNGELYDVLFIGTGNGWLNKAVSTGSTVHLIEELQMFDKPSPVHSLVLSTQTSLLFAGSPAGLVQLSMADCSKYRSCSDCVLARDPFCAWNRNISRCVRFADHNDDLLLQDVQNSDTSMCDVQYTKALKPASRNLTVAIGTNVVLPCELTSNLAQPLWTFNGQELSQDESDSVLYDITLQALVILGVSAHHSGTYFCYSVEQGVRLASDNYQLGVVASPSLTLESRAPMDGLGLVWMMVIGLGAVCLVLFLAVFYLRRKLQDEMEKGSKSLENTLVYPIQLPSQPKIAKCLPSADSDEKLWDPSSFYYSDGSLKIVPGHALCQNSTGSSSPSGNGIPGQPLPSPPLHSPNHMLLSGVRGSNSNGYIRLTLGGVVGEERPPLGELNEELRWKLKQRQTLPDSNPEESSV